MIVATVPVNAGIAALLGVGFVVDVELACAVAATGREDVVDTVDRDARRGCCPGADDPHAPAATSATRASALANP